MQNIVVVLDGTAQAEQLVADAAAAGAHVTAIGRNFREVVAVMAHGVYPLVADLSDPEQWDYAVARVEQRYGSIDRVIDPADRLAVRAA
ncbi:hypothetical protein P0W64_06905 [Tsukamurella sp. 8F]|uniref:hypothetical protein n=1 Tax=unclassified Tsukamurella TaxID=2633480 RepID=UPI0023B9EF98|nr:MULTISPECIES: hypothetical protein [unclassified Tsukamurella]MDF0530184.1 hypothetical protein [Tsukamurella sp. 8J]MDF0586501.1 hypothetical protein [Tsukamurella sp. 8F]